MADAARQMHRVLHLYRACLRSAKLAVTPSRAAEMRHLCRLKFRDGAGRHGDRAQQLLADGINELGFFQYALHLSKQRVGAGLGNLAGEVPSASVSPAFFEQRIRQQLEEGAAASVARAEARRAAGRVPRPAEPATIQTPLRAPGGAVEDGGRPPAVMATSAASAAACACGDCGAALSPTAKFCSECGSQRACTACGTPLARTAKFCSECGTRRSGGQAPR